MLVSLSFYIIVMLVMLHILTSNDKKSDGEIV